MRSRHRPQPQKRCYAKSCGRPIEQWKRLCDGCFRRLPFERRQAIAKAGQEKKPHVVAQLAIEAGAWLDQHPPAGEGGR